MAISRKRASFPVTFKTHLTPQVEKIKKYLDQYLQFVPDDTYWESIHRKLIMGKELTGAEVERAEQLMKSYDLDEAHIDSLLGGREATVIVNPNRKNIGDLIQEVEKVNGPKDSGRLSGWDKNFIFGEGKSWSLYDQWKARKNISPKQEAQLRRMATILGIDHTGYV